MLMKAFKPVLIIATLALFAGLVVGGASVYLTGGLNGNGDDETNITNAACKLDKATSESLDAAIKGDVAAMRLAADKAFPITNIGFELEDGKKTSFADWKGKVVLLNIWATWCGPCREEMPDLAELQEIYGSKNFEVLALNVDRNGGSKPKAFLNEIEANALNLYLDPKNDAFRDLRSKGLVFGLPTTMILDDKGCVQGVLAGIANWSSEDAKNLIEVSMNNFKK